MQKLHPPFEMPRGEADEGHPVAVLGVHVGLHLEDETGDLGFLRLDLPLGGLLRLRLRPIVAHAGHEFADAEGVDGRTEPDRRHVAFEEGLPVEGGQKCARHLDFFAELREQIGGHMIGQLRIVEPGNPDRFRDPVAVGAVHQVQPVVQKVVAADEIAAHADRPAGRRHVDGKVFLNLVDDLERIPAFAVHLVAEGQDRQVTQAADLEKLPRLAFDALRPVDHHDRGIDGGQRPVGVLGKVAMAGGVHQIEAVLPEVEGHGAGGHGNPALLLHLHEIRPRAPRLALGAHLTGHLDGTPEQEELFRQRGLAGIRVRDDGKGAPPGNFRRQGGAVGKRVGHGAGI